MTYDVTTHPLLSPDARAVRDADPNAFDALASAAEGALGLAGTEFAGQQREDARLAVALQTNRLAEAKGGRAVKRVTRGERTVEYADAALTSTGLDPVAAGIAARLIATLAPATPPARRRTYGTGSVRARNSWA